MSVIFFAVLIFINAINFAYANENNRIELDPIVISKGQLEFVNSYTVEEISGSPLEALSNLPLDLQGRLLKGDIQTDFSLRGSTFQGVLILIDGQRINDPQTAHHNCDIPLTAEDIKRIEVIPGAGSSIFGPDAIGGVINIVTKNPDQKKAITLSIGNHKLKSGNLSFSHNTEKYGLRYSLEREESAGFRYGTDFKKFTTSLNSNVYLPQGNFKITLGYQEKEFGAYDFYTPGKGYPSQEWTKTYLLNMGLKLERDTLIIKPNFLWRRHHDKFMLDRTQIRSSYLNHHQTDIYTPSLYLQKEICRLGKIGLGLEYGEEKITSTNLGRHLRDHKSIFLDSTKDLTNNLSLGGSFRYDDFKGFDEVFTGSFSLRYKLKSADFLYFGISRNMRVPSFTELYYNDPTTRGEPNLSAERSLNYELRYDCSNDNFSFGLGAFLRIEKDFIDWIKYTPSQSKWQAENVTEAQVFGVESNIRIMVNKNISLDSNYTYIDKRINDQGYLYKYGPNYIRHLFNSIFKFNLPFGIQTVSFSYKKRPRRDGWFILNTQLSCDLNKNSKLFLNIYNLLNVEYQEIEGIPQPGRLIETGIRFEW